MFGEIDAKDIAKPQLTYILNTTESSRGTIYVDDQCNNKQILILIMIVRTV